MTGIFFMKSGSHKNETQHVEWTREKQFSSLKLEEHTIIVETKMGKSLLLFLSSLAL